MKDLFYIPLNGTMVNNHYGNYMFYSDEERLSKKIMKWQLKGRKK